MSAVRHKKFSWLDIWKQEHAVAPNAAMAISDDDLRDIGKSIEDAIANGDTYETWSKRITPILQAKGWWGHIAPTAKARTNATNRLRAIYDANLRASFAKKRSGK